MTRHQAVHVQTFRYTYIHTHIYIYTYVTRSHAIQSRSFNCNELMVDTFTGALWYYIIASIVEWWYSVDPSHHNESRRHYHDAPNIDVYNNVIYQSIWIIFDECALYLILSGWYGSPVTKCECWCWCWMLIPGLSQQNPRYGHMS